MCPKSYTDRWALKKHYESRHSEVVFPDAREKSCVQEQADTKPVTKKSTVPLKSAKTNAEEEEQIDTKHTAKHSTMPSKSAETNAEEQESLGKLVCHLCRGSYSDKWALKKHYEGKHPEVAFRDAWRAIRVQEQVNTKDISIQSTAPLKSVTTNAEEQPSADSTTKMRKRPSRPKKLKGILYIISD